MAVSNTKKITCPVCAKERTISLYIASVNPFHNGHIPYCKTCLKKLYNNIYSVVKNDAGALWYFCAEIGYPFLDEAWKRTLSKKIELQMVQGYEVAQLYVAVFNEMNKITNGFCDTDTDINEFVVKQENRPLLTSEMSFSDLEKIWGKFEPEDYIYLTKTFNDYVGDEEMDANMTNRYRDLCKAELMLRKANEDGSISDVKNAQDVLNKQLNLLGLNNFVKTEKSDQDRYLDRLIWLIEETEPCEEEDLAKYRDIAGFESAFSHIMRSLKNLITGSRDYPDVPKDEK